ncbi:hypothetical protein DFP73DRAFT_536887 [Morchella snyderi]|nr:hypothetical protein DFP73DRAFT_536887 [Morchella snyderi]
MITTEFFFLSSVGFNFPFKFSPVQLGFIQGHYCKDQLQMSSLILIIPTTDVGVSLLTVAVVATILAVNRLTPTPVAHILG